MLTVEQQAAAGDEGLGGEPERVAGLETVGGDGFADCVGDHRGRRVAVVVRFGAQRRSPRFGPTL